MDVLNTSPDHFKNKIITKVPVQVLSSNPLISEKTLISLASQAGANKVEKAFVKSLYHKTDEWFGGMSSF